MAGQNALILRFGTDLEPARRSVANFAGNAGRNLALLGSTAIVAARNFEQLNTSASMAGRGLSLASRVYATYKLAILGGVAAMALFAKASQAASEAIEEMRRIAAGAESAGVSTTFFQVWEKQAGALKIKVEDLRAALVKAKAATAISVGDDGKRVEPAASKVLRNISEANPNLVTRQLSIVENSSDAEARLRAMLEALREIHKEADRIGNGDLREWAHRLAQVAFGEKGRELSAAIREGSLEMESLIAGAQKAGTIFSTEMVQKTQEFDQQLAAANQKLYSEMVPVFQALASIAIDIKGGWAGTVDAIAAAISQAKGLLAEVQKIRQGILGMAPGRLGDVFKFQDSVGWFKSMSMVATALRDGFQDGPPKQNDPSNPYGTFITGPRLRMQQANPYLAARLRARHDDLQRPVFNRDAEDTASGRMKAPRGGSEIDQVETFTKSLQRQVEVLEAEAKAYGASAAEKERAAQMARAEHAARERGTPLTEKEIELIKRLSERKAEAREKTEQLALAEQRAKETAQFFGNTMVNAFASLARPGANLKSILEDVIQLLIRASLQAMILGQGPFATMFGMAAKEAGGIGGFMGLFAGLFGGGGGGGGGFSPFGLYEDGGVAGFPKKTAVLPHALFANAPRFDAGGMIPGGGIPIVAHPGEIILNTAQQRNVAAAMGGGPPIVNNYGQAGLVDVRQTASRQWVIDVAKEIAQAGDRQTQRAMPGYLASRQARSVTGG